MRSLLLNESPRAYFLRKLLKKLKRTSVYFLKMLKKLVKALKYFLDELYDDLDNLIDDLINSDDSKRLQDKLLFEFLLSMLKKLIMDILTLNFESHQNFFGYLLTTIKDVLKDLLKDLLKNLIKFFLRLIVKFLKDVMLEYLEEMIENLIDMLISDDDSDDDDYISGVCGGGGCGLLDMLSSDEDFDEDNDYSSGGPDDELEINFGYLLEQLKDQLKKKFEESDKIKLEKVIMKMIEDLLQDDLKKSLTNYLQLKLEYLVKDLVQSQKVYLIELSKEKQIQGQQIQQVSMVKEAVSKRVSAFASLFSEAKSQRHCGQYDYFG